MSAKRKTKSEEKPLEVAEEFPGAFDEQELFNAPGDLFVRVADVTKVGAFNKAYRPEIVRIVDGQIAERRFVGDENLVPYAFSRAMELVDPRSRPQ